MKMEAMRIKPEKISALNNQPVVEIIRSERTPHVILNKTEGIIKLSGYSLPENSGDYYYPIHDWILHFIDDAPEYTSVSFDLEYFNSSSFKLLLEIIQTLSRLRIKKKNVDFTWYYKEGDEDMFESGKQLEDMQDVKFEYICYK